ncbi:efflux RND transporter permease subunit [Oligosphaera ethanolica]|uniref:Hydrophobe/amphiphile efflux-1 (HAE1) family protein n=1 Tax=Oligosphaera ethanolica TaxID=760260 RepID=A0AAE4AQP8_9BACT|nr:efflux RND transporter permease subunit [Oligosphaera ethanolica]MDQ0290622.1 hydrophobe/amphiphile efflux-1 (HAE1) family protein [Oligosphaera ethanolica]
MKITQVTLARPVAVGVLVLATAVIGWFSLTRIDVDYLPDINYPMVKIHIWWRGATPEEIETQIADPIERAMSTVENLDYLDASCIEGMYTLLVNFRYGVDVDIAYQDVLAAMGRANRQLPTDMEAPLIIKADPSQLPVMELTISSSDRSLVWLREWADKWLVERLNTVPGTAGAEVVGGVEREIRVHLDPQRLAAYSLTPEKVAAALRGDNRQTFAGRVTVENRELIARTMGEFESLDEIRQVALCRGPNGELVTIQDLAEVSDAHTEMRVITRFNGQSCVKINVLKQAEANTVKVAGAVQAKLAALASEIPPDIAFGVVENQGDYVLGAIKSVRDSAILAAILVVLVIYLFLGHWRQVAIMLVVLPLILLANFFVMKSAGFSLNLFSLGGLVVALGVLLDNSTVVLENITRLLAKKPAADGGGGEHPALVAVRQVGPAIVAATVSFLALFLPFLFIPGMASLLFHELVLTVASIVVISLLFAVTLTPFLASRWLKADARPGAAARLFAALVDWLTGVYGWLLGWCLRWRYLTVLAFAAVLAMAVIGAKRLGTEFFPELDDGRVMVKVKMPSGTSVAETDRVLAKIEEQVKGLPDVRSVFTMAGGRIWGLATYEIANEGEVNILLKPKAERRMSTAEFVQHIRPMVNKLQVPGAKMPVMQMKVKGIRQIGVQAVEVKVQGTDVQDMYAFARALASGMSDDPSLVNVNISMDMTKPEYRVYIDRARASALQIPVERVATTLRTLVTGLVATEFREGSEYYDIRVMVPEPRLNSREDLAALVVDVQDGQPIYVRDIAEIRRSVGPVEITRENQVKQIIVRADPADGVKLNHAIAQAEALAASLPKVPGLSTALGGQAQMMAENTRTMGLLLAFAAFFAFAVLAIQFENVRLPAVIFVSLPICLGGMVFGLMVGGMSFGATVAIGVFIVISAAVNDGVLLLELAEELRREAGQSALPAVLAAAKARLRPRVMTTVSTIAGFIPLALNMGEGGDLLQPMAVAAIGGLLLEIVTALFLMPALYVFFAPRDRRQPLPA